MNIDFDSITTLRKDILTENLENLRIKNLDIFDLPFKDNSVDEIRAEAFIEHLSFFEERKFFCEVKRVLKHRGKINFSTINFEKQSNIGLSLKMIGKIFIKLQKKPYRKNIGLELILIIIQINGDTLLQVYTEASMGEVNIIKIVILKKN